MRCVYCRPLDVRADLRCPTLGRSILTPPEIERLARHLVEARGFRNMRLTGGEPARRPDLAEVVTHLGFFLPMSCPFCYLCDRIRIEADGSVYPSLIDQLRGRLLPAIRPSFDSQRCTDMMRRSPSQEAGEHAAVGFGVMTQIGG